MKTKRNRKPKSPRTPTSLDKEITIGEYKETRESLDQFLSQRRDHCSRLNFLLGKQVPGSDAQMIAMKWRDARDLANDIEKGIRRKRHSGFHVLRHESEPGEYTDTFTMQDDLTGRLADARYWTMLLFERAVRAADDTNFFDELAHAMRWARNLRHEHQDITRVQLLRAAMLCKRVNLSRVTIRLKRMGITKNIRTLRQIAHRLGVKTCAAGAPREADEQENLTEFGKQMAGLGITAYMDPRKEEEVRNQLARKFH
jgi:hypothetical protein